MGSYEPPVDQLLKIGDLRIRKEWHDYRALGIGPENVPDLIRMAVDEDLNNAASESAEAWGFIHAWRALGTLRAESAIPTLVGLLAGQKEGDFNDWITEELPEVLGMIGPAAIPALTKLLEEETAYQYARIDAAQSLAKIAQRHPEARSECVALLSGMLERAERNDPALNGFIVSELIDLDASEAAVVIEQAYARDLVDDSICGTWYDVWHRFDLEGEPPPQTERKYTLGDEQVRKVSDLLQAYSRQTSGKPAEARRPENRKERNKARQKLEKKLKGKGGRRR
jgi:Protein of unknown function (DUF1186)